MVKICFIGRDGHCFFLTNGGVVQKNNNRTNWIVQRNLKSDSSLKRN